MMKSKDIDTNKPSSIISLIAAIGKGRELGKNGKLLWHLPDDMRRFKELTTGHPVIMGRKTWESLPERFRPLPGRTNIVVTRQADYKAAGAIVADSLGAARAVAARAEGANEIFVIGGGELYAVALPLPTVSISRSSMTLPRPIRFSHRTSGDFKIISDEAGTGEPPHRFLTLNRE